MGYKRSYLAHFFQFTDTNIDKVNVFDFIFIITVFEMPFLVQFVRQNRLVSWPINEWSGIVSRPEEHALPHDMHIRVLWYRSCTKQSTTSFKKRSKNQTIKFNQNNYLTLPSVCALAVSIYVGITWRTPSNSVNHICMNPQLFSILHEPAMFSSFAL